MENLDSNIDYTKISNGEQEENDTIDIFVLRD